MTTLPAPAPAPAPRAGDLMALRSSPLTTSALPTWGAGPGPSRGTCALNWSTGWLRQKVKTTAHTVFLFERQTYRGRGFIRKMKKTLGEPLGEANNSLPTYALKSAVGKPGDFLLPVIPGQQAIEIIGNSAKGIAHLNQLASSRLTCEPFSPHWSQARQWLPLRLGPHLSQAHWWQTLKTRCYFAWLGSADLKKQSLHQPPTDSKP